MSRWRSPHSGDVGSEVQYADLSWGVERGLKPVMQDFE